jgi:hypothetical protein
MEKTFLILNILAIIICSYFFFMKINSYEKKLLTLSIFFQLIIIFCIYNNINYLIKFIDKIFILTIIFGIFIVENFYINMFIIFLLFITLFTRYYFKRCLFFLKENNYKKDSRCDFGFLILFMIYLLKLLYMY